MRGCVSKNILWLFRVGTLAGVIAIWGQAAAYGQPGSGIGGLALLGESRPTTGYLPVVRPLAEDLVSSRRIYLNRCASGCAFIPGTDDSRADRTQVLTRPAEISAFPYGDETWNEVVACVREVFAPFDVELLTEDPSPLPHFEAVIAGTPQEVGHDERVGGVAAFDALGCGVIDNAISFTFPMVWEGNVRDICETAAQEIAHSLGLDHAFYCEDVMTYLTDCGDKGFRDVDVPCGESQERTCACGAPTQNSYQRVLDLFGPADVTPPAIVLMEPEAGQTVTPRFRVRADVTDNIAVSLVALVIDGAVVEDRAYPPYVFAAPDDLAPGPHVVEIRATDSKGLVSSAVVEVVQGPPCARPESCENGDVCVGGRCVAGPGTPGGLGETCSSAAQCSSAVCGDDGSGTRYCLEVCETDKGCPCGFACIPASTGGGVCWPAGACEDGGGCAVVPGQSERLPRLWLWVILVAGALMLARAGRPPKKRR